MRKSRHFSGRIEWFAALEHGRDHRDAASCERDEGVVAAGRASALPWFLLAARLVAATGKRVLRHGWNSHQADGVRSVLAVAGIGRGAGREAAKPVKDTLAPGGAGAVQGAIALVGAGPGAADLLTLRALRLLQEADVIYYDRLVDPAVLELAGRDAERVFVGKEVGACSWPQDRINAVIVAAARQGRRVVRLKSGDPGVFGRVTEELEAARHAGIPVEIVPGVTAASAAAASLGRGLTERGVTDRLMLATAACKPGDPEPDWATMLKPGTSLAIYMGVGKAQSIISGMQAAGIPMSLQTEVTSHASTAREKTVCCTLGQLPRALIDGAIGNPAVILVSWPKSDAQGHKAEIAA